MCKVEEAAHPFAIAVTGTVLGYALLIRLSLDQFRGPSDNDAARHNNHHQYDHHGNKRPRYDHPDESDSRDKQNRPKW